MFAKDGLSMCLLGRAFLPSLFPSSYVYKDDDATVEALTASWVVTFLVHADGISDIGVFICL